MKIARRNVCSLVAVVLPLAIRGQEPTVSKDSISVHTVERGDMPLSTPAAGSITSLRPPRALATLSERSEVSCKTGQVAYAQLGSGKSLSGKIIHADRGKCEIEFSEPFPSSATIGTELGALIRASQKPDVVFFARPADAKANSDASVFVVESGDQYARRVTVRYGEISGPMIEVVSGLSPGDRVIVTDMSRVVTSPRVRLQ